MGALLQGTAEPGPAGAGGINGRRQAFEVTPATSSARVGPARSIETTSLLMPNAPLVPAAGLGVRLWPVIFAVVSATVMAAGPAYPPTARQPVTETLHGVP